MSRSKRQRRNANAARHQAATTPQTQQQPALKRRAFRPPRDKSVAGGWIPSTASQDHAPAALPRIRSAARDLAQNNPYAMRAVSVLTAHSVGTGIRASMSGDPDFEAAFEDWAGSTRADREGRLSFYGVQHLAARTMYEAGDALIVMRDVRTPDGLTLTLQVVDPEQLDSGAAPQARENKVHQGVEVDRSGRIVGYHVKMSLEEMRSVFIPRRDAVHMLEILYPGQVRGVPRGAQALSRANGVDSFMSTALARAKVEACLTAFVTTTEADGGGGLIGAEDDEDQGGYLPPENLEPGMIVPLNPGEDVKVAQPPTSGGMADYVKIGLQAVAVSYGTTYDAISGDLEKVNFSSQKAGRLEFNRNIDSVRAHTIFPALRKIVRRFSDVYEANTGLKPRPKISFVAPGRESVEPLKDAQTLNLELQAGVKTWSQAVRERGHDPDEQIAEIAALKSKFADAGLSFKLEMGPVTITGIEKDDDDDGTATGGAGGE